MFMVKDAYTVLMTETLARLACPVCHAGLVQEGGRIRCEKCGRKYPVVDGIPVLLPERAEL